jgi:hypothetical protein
MDRSIDLQFITCISYHDSSLLEMARRSVVQTVRWPKAYGFLPGKTSTLGRQLPDLVKLASGSVTHKAPGGPLPGQLIRPGVALRGPCLVGGPKRPPIFDNKAALTIKFADLERQI